MSALFGRPVGEQIRSHIDAVEQTTGISRVELMGRSRFPTIVAARNELYARLWRAGFSLSEIASIFGRHHTGIIHGLRKCVGAREYTEEMGRRR